MSSVANDFDDILKDIAKALYKNSDINDLGKALGFWPADIGRTIQENGNQGGNYMGTLDLLRKWRNTQTSLTEKAALRSALLEAGFNKLADQYLNIPVPGKRFFIYNGSIKRFIQKKKENPNYNKNNICFHYSKVSKQIMNMIVGRPNFKFKPNCASCDKSTNFGTQVVEHFRSKTRC